MSFKCDLTGKRPAAGKSVSHSHRKTNRLFSPNLQKKRFFSPELGRTVELAVSAKALRSISKKGLNAFLKTRGKELVDFA